MDNCRNIRNKMDELRRCGCDRCRYEFYNLEKQLYVNRYDPYAERYYPNPLLGVDAGASPSISQLQVITKMENENKIEEPKNVAVKTLVDKLKVEQTALSSAKTSLEVYKKYVKTYSENKNKAEKNIRELSVALKKLGHKDV